MTKREFIWLVIRAVGLFKLIVSLRFVFSAIGTFIVMLTILPVDNGPGKVILIGLFGMLLESISPIIIVIYLLLFGKTIYHVVHRTSCHTPEVVLEKTDYAEILMRFIGFWWLWRIVCQIFRLVNGLLYAVILSHPKWLNNDIAYEATDSQLWKELIRVLHPLQQQMVWSVLLNILIYSILAWYFLKHARFFMNLLNRLWLGKVNQDVVNVSTESQSS